MAPTLSLLSALLLVVFWETRAVTLGQPAAEQSKSTEFLGRDNGEGGQKMIRSISVFCEDGSRSSCTAADSKDASDANARARYNISSNYSTGFASLDVRHGPIANKSRLNITAFAMGYAEGYLTASEIAVFYPNVYEFGPTGPSDDLVDFVTKNIAWTQQQVAANADTDDFWHQVGLVLSRLDGMVAGYTAAAKNTNLPAMTFMQFIWMNLDGDLFDLQTAIPAPTMMLRAQAGPLDSSPRDLRLKRLRGFRCSALFKLADDYSDIFFGHTTWDTYATASPRIFKHIKLPVLRNGTISSRIMSMSSSPGMLGSLDDWYELGEDTTNTSMVVTETSVQIYNTQAYVHDVKPQSALCWIRMLVANALATSAPRWAETFSKSPSGTYNNQWMVLDVQKFNPGTKPPADTFWVLEEVPGRIKSKDSTDDLTKDGYWGSYNVLKFDSTREVSGEEESYTECVRARLAKAMQSHITSLEKMQHFIGWNDYQHSEISADPMDAIMARGDLLSTPYAVGGIDAKVSSATLVQNGLVSIARAGPTVNSLDPFCWSSMPYDDTPHHGHPQCFKYQWGALQPLTDW